MKSITSFYIYLILAAVIVSVGLINDSVAIITSAIFISPMLQPVFKMVKKDALLLPKEMGMLTSGILLVICIGLIIGKKTVPFTETQQMRTRSKWPKTLGSVALNLLMPFISGFALAVGKTSGNTIVLLGASIATSILPPICNSGIYMSNDPPQYKKAIRSFLLGIKNLIITSIVYYCTMTFLL